jgi:putative phage-type endonuclease
LQVRNFPSREEWLQARKNYIGGSDAAAILGLNPWKTNVDLWEEKTGRKEAADISDNEAVKFGSLSEPYLRELFKLDNPDLDVRYIENNMFINDTYPWAHASLDGWMKDKEGRAGILEIKTTTIQNYASVKKWENKIPDNYYCQILHYFLVTGFDFAIVKARLKFDFENPYCQIRHYRIERQECENDIILLMDAERRFAENIKNDIRPSLLLPEI